MKRDALSPYLIRQLFILALIIFIGYLITKELVPYLSGILGAVTLYVLFNGMMSRMLHKGIKPWLASTVIIIISIFIIVIPIGATLIMLTSRIKETLKNTDQVTELVKDKLEVVEKYLGFHISSNFDAKHLTDWVSSHFTDLVGSTFNAGLSLTIMYFILYFMLLNRRNLRKYFMVYVPLSDENLNVIAKDSRNIVKSNAIGIPLVAILQGVVALIGYYIFGVPNAFFWFVITTIGSMIPFVGTAIGIVPVTILLLAQNHDWQAIGILIYGFAIVGSTDNIFRMVVQNRLANLHPLITLIGVLIGVPLFGFIGLVFGPLLLSLFLLLVRIYKNEYGENGERYPVQEDPKL
ncbi:AI-2E family transporter [Zhouia sp. PK063]|uniref:AI-2E family transporter n=1 Tax=Zhouia sp. PK063 TaxID=3373602 RepID=UPI0037925C0A